MSNKKLMKKVLVISLSATMVFAIGSSVYASTQALPNGTIVNQNGANYLTDSKGEKYSGWFKDSKEDWYYFNESDKSMKTGWHHDDKDGYWYYLNLSDGKMAMDWQTIDGKEYFFQPVRDMGNYNFNNEQEKWFYSINSKIPYGAMYVNTTTPDGSKVDNTGAKVVKTENGNKDTTATETVKNGWVSENGNWHYYDNGALAKNKWLNLDGKWYYVLSDGAMVSNTWKEIGGKTYYFGSDGAMYVNTATPDGRTVDGQGALVIANEIDYNQYVGLFWEKESYHDLLSNIQNNGFEVGLGYFRSNAAIDIEKIEHGKVYGKLDVYASVTGDSWKSSFQGVKLGSQGDFKATVHFEEGGRGARFVGEAEAGLRKPYEGDFIADCKLIMRDGTPIVVVNGTLKFDSRSYDASLQNLTFVKVKDKEIVEWWKTNEN